MTSQHQAEIQRSQIVGDHIGDHASYKSGMEERPVRDTGEDRINYSCDAAVPAAKPSERNTI